MYPYHLDKDTRGGFRPQMSITASPLHHVYPYHPHPYISFKIQKLFPRIISKYQCDRFSHTIIMKIKWLKDVCGWSQ